MSGTLLHEVEDIIRQLIIDLQLGEPIESPLADWTVYAGNLADKPDNAIAVADTPGLLQGRAHVDGQMAEKYGIQVVVRSNNVVDSYTKAKAISDSFDQDVYRTEVVVEDETYLVQSIKRTSPVIKMGYEPGSKRYKRSLNAIVSLSYVEPGTGSGTGS